MWSSKVRSKGFKALWYNKNPFPVERSDAVS